jgi:hypothetical protein
MKNINTNTNINTNPEAANFAIEARQSITIEFIGGKPRSNRQYKDSYTVTVPYSSFARKLRSIQRDGGKIINVSILRFKLDLPKPEIVVIDVVVAQETAIAVGAEPILAVIPEIIPETIITSEPIAEPIVVQVEELPIEIVAEVETEAIVEVVTPLEVVQPKKNKTSIKAKSGSGFNKRS